jgi:hypothetical protein
MSRKKELLFKINDGIFRCYLYPLKDLGVKRMKNKKEELI